MSIEIAKTILQQLGGNKFTMMTGAKDLIAGEDYFAFKLPSRFAKNGINYVKIILKPSDTYTIEFKKCIWSRVTCQDIEISTDIYCDALQQEFTRITGLHTHF